MEEWRPIKDYEGFYEVSNLGRVKSLDRIIIDSKGRKRLFEGKIMKLKSDRYGYLYVSLNKNGKKNFKVHRLVAEAFIPNTEDKKHVDHINTNKEDNRVENLRWVTPKENNNNELTKEHKKGCQLGEKNACSKCVIQISLDGKLIKKYGSINEATRETGFNKKYISFCCNGKIENYKGYKWIFYNDYK